MTVSSKMGRQRWKFLVFVAAVDHANAALIKNLQSLLHKHAKGAVCEVDIVDVTATPHLAEEFHVVVVPTIIRLQPTPVRKLVGNFDEEASFLQALGIENFKKGNSPRESA